VRMRCWVKVGRCGPPGIHDDHAASGLEHLPQTVPRPVRHSRGWELGTRTHWALGWHGMWKRFVTDRDLRDVFPSVFETADPRARRTPRSVADPATIPVEYVRGPRS